MLKLLSLCQWGPAYRHSVLLGRSRLDIGKSIRIFRNQSTLTKTCHRRIEACRFGPKITFTPIYVTCLRHAASTSKALGVKRLSITGELRRLLGLAKDEKWRLAGAVCLLFVSSAVTMAVPFCMGKIIDTIYTSDTEAMKTKLTMVGQILLAVFLVGAAANFGRVYLMLTTGFKITQRLRTSVFNSIMKQEMAFFDRNKTGELINRLSSDSALVANSLSINISDGLRSFIAIGAGVSMMFYTSTELALVGLATVPPVVGLAIVYGRYVRKIATRVQDSLARTTQLAEERISNVRTVRAFAQEDRECRTYAEQNMGVLRLMYKESLAKGLFFGMTGLSGNVVVLSVLCYGGLMVTQSEITVGNLSAFLLYAAYVGISFGGLSSAYSETMKGLGASTRLWQIIDRVPAIPAVGSTIPFESIVGDIEFRGVSFHYPSRPDARIFDDLDLVVPAGSVTAIVGSSGSGKSTLAHLILRLYDPISGNVYLDGKKMSTLHPNWIRTVIGTVTQEPILFSCSIKENILYGATDPTSVTDDQLIEVCREANAYDFIAGFPDQFQTVVGERGIMLSGGQRQRIAIARALLKNPKILLLDEATSALDAESEYLVKEALERLMTGRTVLTIAHRLSTIASADQIAVLADGRITELGSYDSLMTLPNGLFRKLVERQTIASDR